MPESIDDEIARMKEGLSEEDFEKWVNGELSEPSEGAKIWHETFQAAEEALERGQKIAKELAHGEFLKGNRDIYKIRSALNVIQIYYESLGQREKCDRFFLAGFHVEEDDPIVYLTLVDEYTDTPISFIVETKEGYIARSKIGMWDELGTYKTRMTPAEYRNMFVD